MKSKGGEGMVADLDKIRAPQPPVYVFIIDVSQNAIQSGALNIAGFLYVWLTLHRYGCHGRTNDPRIARPSPQRG